jgi:hypothetical protein
MTGRSSIVSWAPSSEQDGGQGSPLLLTLEGLRVFVGLAAGLRSVVRRLLVGLRVVLFVDLVVLEALLVVVVAVAVVSLVGGCVSTGADGGAVIATGGGGVVALKAGSATLLPVDEQPSVKAPITSRLTVTRTPTTAGGGEGIAALRLRP